MRNGAWAGPEPFAVGGILHGRAAATDRAVSALAGFVAAVVGQHGRVARGFPGWPNSGKGRLVVPYGADPSALALEAGSAFAAGDGGMPAGEIAGVLGRAGDSVPVLAAVPGDAGLSRNLIASVSADAGGIGRICHAEDCGAGFAPR